MAKLTFELDGKTADVLNNMVDRYGNEILEILATDISHAIYQMQLELLADEVKDALKALK